MPYISTIYGRIQSIYRALTFQNPKADDMGEGAGGMLDLAQVKKKLKTKCLQWFALNTLLSGPAMLAQV